MSKSLGNSPDPIDLIETYGADGVRMGMMLSAPAGNDILYDNKLCEQGRNFCNKIWNAFRLVKGWEISETAPRAELADIAAKWFDARLKAAVDEVNDLFDKFRISEALMVVYRLVRDDFSAWYLEMMKPAYGQPLNSQDYKAVCDNFDALLRLLHPFMPFITEELWQNLYERREGESIMYAPMPDGGNADTAIINDMAVAQEIVTGVRGVRASKNIPNKDGLTLNAVECSLNYSQIAVITKLANVSQVVNNATTDGIAASFMVGVNRYDVPLADNIDVDAELKRLTSDLEYQQGFLASVMKKLGNERFVNNAPAAVVDVERRKKTDAEAKIEALKASIAALSK